MRLFVKFCSDGRCFLLLGLIFKLITETFSLKCYECFWSRETVDPEEYEEKYLMRKALKYPMVEGPILDSKTYPSSPEDLKKCPRRNCPDSHSCLTWSYSSNEPLNITYTCVGNRDSRKGCYEQEIPEKHLKVKACLCDKDECNYNHVSSLHNYKFVNVIYFVIFSLFMYKRSCVI